MKGERKYWPAEWVDETVPPGRASPSDFIIDLGGGCYFLGYPLDALDVTEFQKRFYNTGIDPDDTVEFMWADDLGSIEITILSDGDFGAPDVPEGATHFWFGDDTATLAHSIGEFVSQWIATNNNLAVRHGTMRVNMACWSEGIPHQFMPAIEGKIGPQFVSLKMESETVQ